MKEKSETYQKNVNKRGNVPNSIMVRINIYGQKKGDKFPVGPMLLGFFLFIVVGSAIFQILNTAAGNTGGTL